MRDDIWLNRSLRGNSAHPALEGGPLRVTLIEPHLDKI
jgi:hypothetical protein